MAILDLLSTKGSPYSLNGVTPQTNLGATRSSALHAEGDQPSYSVNGNNRNPVNSAYQQYMDGTNNQLPQPSQLDRDNGNVPSKNKYLNNLPE
jgi:hypothetical protein